MSATASVLDGLTFRLVAAPAADLGPIAALVNEAFAIYPFMTSDRTSVNELAEEAGDNGEFILAEHRGDLVGCAMIRPAVDIGPILSTSPRPPSADALYYGVASVSTRVMRAGIGRRLLARAEDEGRARGYRKLVLGTLREMGNVEYYQAFGYRTVATEDFAAGHWDITIAHQEHEMEKLL